MLAKSAEVLELEAFSETTLRTFVNEILVPEPGKLIFCFVGGRRVQIEWQNSSRRNSWTPEMREAARQKEIERRQTK